MFRRKEEESQNSETEKKETPAVKDEKTTPTAAGSDSVSAQVQQATPVVPAAARPAVAPAADVKVSPLASSYRPATPVAATPVAAARPAPIAAPAASQEDKSRRRVLTVGNDILLKGEIATCDRLVIEGSVDAKLNDVHTVEIAETGSFKGSAEIQDAEISGLFEGDLTVRNRLIIYSTGKVRGKITYGEIEIERGGELTGEIRIAGEATDAEKAKDGKNKAA